jgi:large subunit ribosomal protein L6
MSRIGKKPIPLPNGVKITVGEELEVTGPKGKLKVPIPGGSLSSRPTASWK